MTVICDAKRRVVLPGVEPGDRFDVQRLNSERLLIVRLQPAEPRPRKVRFEKRGRLTVGVAGRQVDPSVLKEALADYP